MTQISFFQKKYFIFIYSLQERNYKPNEAVKATSE